MNIDGLVPMMIVIFGLLGWAVIEITLWVLSNLSITWG